MNHIQKILDNLQNGQKCRIRFFVFKHRCWDGHFNVWDSFYVDINKKPISECFFQAIDNCREIECTFKEKSGFIYYFTKNEEIIAVTEKYIEDIYLIETQDPKRNATVTTKKNMSKRITDKESMDEFLCELTSDDSFELEIHNFNHKCWSGSKRDAEEQPIRRNFKAIIIYEKPIICRFTKYNDITEIMTFENDYDETICLKMDHIKSVKAIDSETEKETTMTHATSTLSNMKQIALDGARLAIGKKAATVLQTHVLKTLKKLKVPDAILNHKLTQLAIFAGTPNLLKLVLEFVPSDKIPEKVFTVLDAACVASAAQISEEALDLVQTFLKPVLKELTALNVTALPVSKK